MRLHGYFVIPLENGIHFSARGYWMDTGLRRYDGDGGLSLCRFFLIALSFENIVPRTSPRRRKYKIHRLLLPSLTYKR